MHRRSPSQLVAGVILACALAGCASIGPTIIKRDRTDYSGAMASSWKEQMLLNIVKFRYFDPPVFLDISSVVSTQELQTQLDATARVFPHPLTNVSSAQNFYNLDAMGRYIDRPDHLIHPITGDHSSTVCCGRSAADDLHNDRLGHDAGFILVLAVRSINGIYNYSLSPRGRDPWIPKFEQLVVAIRRIQQVGAIATRNAKTGKIARPG